MTFTYLHAPNLWVVRRFEERNGVWRIEGTEAAPESPRGWMCYEREITPKKYGDGCFRA